MTKKSPFGLTLTPLVLVTALGATACGDVSDPVDPSNGSEAEDVVSDAVTLRLTNNTPQRVYFTVFQDNSGLGTRAARCVAGCRARAGDRQYPGPVAVG